MFTTNDMMFLKDFVIGSSIVLFDEARSTLLSNDLLSNESDINFGQEITCSIIANNLQETD
jgi:hypothetical protein